MMVAKRLGEGLCGYHILYKSQENALWGGACERWPGGRTDVAENKQ